MTNLMQDYTRFQRQMRDERVLIRSGSVTRSEVDGKLNKSPSVAALLHAEITRLIDGFRGMISSSSLVTSAKLFLNSFNGIPEWQKSNNWMPITASKHCCGCAKEFSFIRKNRHCRVCGALICAECSSEDLLLYVPNESSDKYNVKWSIINDFGCPSSEPTICIYLRVCTECQSALSNLLVHQAECNEKQVQVKVKETDAEKFFKEISAIHNKLASIKAKVQESLPKYQKSIESMGIDSGSPKSSPNIQNNIQALAKLQIDISDELSSFILSLQPLKNIKSQNSTQNKLLECVKMGSIKFYYDNITVFRTMKIRLENAVPPEVLTEIQSEVNKNAINGTYIYVKQLIMEYLILSQLHHFQNELADVILPCEKVSFIELQKCITARNEDFSKHINTIDTFLKYQLELQTSFFTLLDIWYNKYLEYGNATVRFPCTMLLML
ncbi:uncharacterized protein TRIADDRAFT_60209 [Trichoplax adhaerens]|uniref:FYVE-type domain-containing protein n=1 Tax=Trichoplax adhaerens TaxID=10228 RepID=B3S7L5_TRIAD|nr:predicted protein [Trichoplax adhaerens]EDV21312.1 predicted protein [Trichoplax adhaerens]|eukprot:XP_002116279.1 predicted protein [Trichoplax adhaerens]